MEPVIVARGKVDDDVEVLQARPRGRWQAPQKGAQVVRGALDLLDCAV